MGLTGISLAPRPIRVALHGYDADLRSVALELRAAIGLLTVLRCA
jgi:hypothetical protein